MVLFQLSQEVKRQSEFERLGLQVDPFRNAREANNEAVARAAAIFASVFTDMTKKETSLKNSELSATIKWLQHLAKNPELARSHGKPIIVSFEERMLV